MKNLIFIMLILSSFVVGQGNNYNDINQRTTIQSSDGLFVNVPADNYTYGSSMASVALFMFNYDRVMNGVLTFTTAPSLPTTIPTGAINRIAIPSGRLSWTDASGNVVAAATTQELADAGLGTATDYARTTIANSFDIKQTMSGGLRIADGQLLQFGNVQSDFSPSTYGIFQMPNGRLWNNWVDYDNDKGLDEFAYMSDLADLGINGAITTATSQSGISGTKGVVGTWDFTGGNIRIGQATPSLTGELNYSLSQGSEGLSLYTGSSVMEIPSSDRVDDKLDDLYSYNAPDIITASTDEISFADDNNYLARIYQPPASGLVITVNDAGWGFVAFTIEGGTQESISIITQSGIEVEWKYDDIPTFPYVSGRIYEVVVKRVNATTIKASYDW